MKNLAERFKSDLKFRPVASAKSFSGEHLLGVLTRRSFLYDLSKLEGERTVTTTIRLRLSRRRSG